MADTRRELSALQTLLADNTAGDIGANDARDVLVSDHPSKQHQTSAFASPPSDPVTGDLWLPSDGFALQRYSGSLWVPWGPLYPLKDPTIPSWSWLNQGSATVTSAGGALFLEGVASEGDQIHARVKAVPTAPYTITAAVLPRLTDVTNAGGFPNCGLAWSDGTTGGGGGSNVIILGYYYEVSNNVPQLYVRKYDDSHNFNAGALSSAPACLPSSPLWLRISDDNTNRKAWVSGDGVNWFQVYSEARTTFLTATHVGFYANTHSSGDKPGLTILSWLEA